MDEEWKEMASSPADLLHMVIIHLSVSYVLNDL